MAGEKTRVQLKDALDAVFYPNDLRLITAAQANSVLTDFINSMRLLLEPPADVYTVKIENSDLSSMEYTIAHNLDCNEVDIIVYDTDDKQIRGDEYFTIERINANNHKMIWLEAIPAGYVKIVIVKLSESIA